MKKYVLTVTLNPAIDKIVSIPGFRLGKDYVHDDPELSAGGKGINVSRALKSFHVPALATGLIGGFTGEFISKSLNRDRIANDFLKVSVDTRTNLTIADPLKGLETRVLEPGNRVPLYELNHFQKKFTQMIRSAHCVVLAGRAPHGAPEDFYARLIRTAKQNNVPTFLDSHSDPFTAALKAKPFAIKPNHKEAGKALGQTLDSVAKVKDAVKHFHRMGIRFVAVSMADKGAVVSDGSDIVLAVPPRIRVKNQVGCGDSFVGGCVYGFVRGLKFSDVVRYAIAAGTANTQNPTPGLFDRSLVDRLTGRVKIKLI